MKNLLILIVVTAVIAGCKRPLKEHCCKTTPAVKSTQTDTSYEAQLRQMYKFDTRKISITTEPSGAEIYQITESEKLKFLGESPLQNQPVTVLTGISEGLDWERNTMDHLSHLGSVRVVIFKEGYRWDSHSFSTDPNEMMSYNVKLTKN
jgi:hypothetical protein